MYRFVWVICLFLASVAPAADPGPWRPIGFSGGGGMFSPAISPADPNLMMLNCDMGAAYLSQDGGHNWQMIHHAQLRSDTACRPGFHPTDANIVYASSGGRLRISHDRGRTFQPIGDLRESLYGEIAINTSNPNVMLVGTRGNHVQISRDGGKTWTRCNGPQGQVIAFHFDQTRGGFTLFAATKSGIWRSVDAGQTWLEKSTGLPWTDIQGFAAGSDTAKNVVILYCSILSRAGNGVLKGGIYRSRDRGDTWESAMGAGLNKETTAADRYAYAPVVQYHQLLAADARPSTVYALNTATGFHPPHHETVYRSDDAGETWRATYFQDPRFKECNVEPDYMVASTGQSMKGGNPPFGIAIGNRDPDRILYVMNAAHVTHDGGARWFNASTHPTKPRASASGRGVRTTSSQKSSVAASNAPPSWLCNGQVVTTNWHYYVDPFETNRHYIGYTDIGFGRSLDAGESWIWWSPKTWAPWRNTCYELAFDPATPGKIWAAFSDVHDIPNDNIISERHGHNRPGGVCVSHDFAASWKVEAKGLPARAVTSIVLDPKSPVNARTLYAGVFDEGVFKSTDDGATWSLKKQGLGDPKNMRVYRVFLHPDGTLFALICAKRPAPRQPLMAEGVGLYRSRDGGDAWEKVNAEHPFLYPKDFSVHPSDSRRILLGTCDTGGSDSSGGLYGTEDGGKTWQRLARQGPQTFGGYFHPKHDDWMYMTLTEGAPGAGLWLSTDRGRNWNPFEALPFSNIQRVEIDPRNDRTMNVTTFGGSIWRGPQDLNAP